VIGSLIAATLSGQGQQKIKAAANIAGGRSDLSNSREGASVAISS
jgi:hypothetical protein